MIYPSNGYTVAELVEALQKLNRPNAKVVMLRQPENSGVNIVAEGSLCWQGYVVLTSRRSEEPR